MTNLPAETARYTVAVLLIAVLLGLAFAGCTTLRTDRQQVTVPAAPSTVQAPTATVVDTLERLPPVPPRGVRTAPTTATTYTEVASTPTVSTERVSVSHDPAEVKIQYRVGEEVRVETWPLPAWGETLDIEAQTDTTTRAQVRDAPAPHETEAVVTTETPSDWAIRLRRTMIFFAGTAVGILIGRFIL